MRREETGSEYFGVLQRIATRTKKYSDAVSVTPFLFLGLVIAAVACGDGGSSTPPEDQSTALDAVGEAPLLGVFLADCTESGTGTVGDAQEESPEAPVEVVELPPADSLFSGDIEEFLVLLELHGNDLPILAGLTSTMEDPTIALPLPLDEVLARLPEGSVPKDAPLVGRTSFGCSEEPGGPTFGVVPLFGPA